MNVADRHSKLSLGSAGNGSKDKQGDVNMNEAVDENGYISLNVVLPDRQVKTVDVKYDTPMMDLLVQVASSTRLKPGEHGISVVSEETGRTLEYKSSQSIGSLGVNRIFLISKAMQRMERENEIQKQKDASKFEQTIRVTINLPRGVKSLQRLNPQAPIMDIFRKICVEKGLDPSRYEVRLSKQSNKAVDMSQTLNDYHANEITIVQCSAPDFHTSMIDISRTGKGANTGGQNGGAARMSEHFDKVKKKKGLFAFLRRDKTKSAVEESSKDETDIPKAWRKLEQQGKSQSIQALPRNGDVTMSRKPQAQVKPQPKAQQTIQEEENEEEIVLRTKAKRAPSKKKYRAPAPPSRPFSTMDPIGEEKKTPLYASTPNLITPPPPVSNDRSRRNHSRNSSDSSGYHEPSVTPPDSASSPSTIDTSSLPRPVKKTAPVASKQKVTSTVQRSQTLPAGASAAAAIGAAAPSKRATKKKAAPPAPPMQSNAKSIPSPKSLTLSDKIVESEEETASISSQDDNAPELGIASFSSKSAPPPIFIPPPPPKSPPPPAMSESPHREPASLVFESPGSVHDEQSKSASESIPVALHTLHTRSESRCSRASVDTIDDVQQYFDLAIAAGERQLRSEQGATSPLANKGVSKLTEDMTTLTSKLEKEPEKPVEPASSVKLAKPSTPVESAKPIEPPKSVPPVKPVEPTKPVSSDKPHKSEKQTKPMEAANEAAQHEDPTQDDLLAAVNQIDLSIVDDEGSDGSLVPDGENFVVAASKLPSGGAIDDADEDSKSDGGVKPVEEISYGFDNPFKNEVLHVHLDSDVTKESLAKENLGRRDSQMSDSTLPDSEHTDRPLSSSLQSSGLQSDEESVTETGDGYETTGTEKVSQSETDTSTDVVDSPLISGTPTAKTAKRGMFLEAKGQDVNSIIYGEAGKGSIRGVPGQDSTDSEVKTRTASFTPQSANKSANADRSKPESSRPKSILSVLTSEKIVADAPKRRPASAIVGSVSAAAAPPAVASKPAVSKEPVASGATLYTRPLPVYNRMNRSDSKPSESAPVTSPTKGAPLPLASVIADSIKSGDAAKSIRKQPETASKPMFFRANRNSRVEVPKSPDRIENVVKLDTSKFEVTAPPLNNNSLPPVQSPEQKKPPPTAAKPSKPGASLNRKGSMKEQYNTLQENMARWQDKLKDNENRVRELTTSQQNLALAGLQVESKPVIGGMVKSTSTSEALSKRPFAPKDDDTMYKSVPSELQKVTLKSAAVRVIPKPVPQLDPVESLMKTIRDRVGRASDSAPDRGIYVANGERESVPVSVTQREIAPTVANGVPPPPAPPVSVKPSATRTARLSSQKLLNGTDKSNDPRFNKPPSTRDSLLAEISNARGKPSTRRSVTVDSSSQSSSDELREIDVVRHKPQKTRHKNSKRSVSDPFPPQGPNSRNQIQPTPTKLDPREELMIAVRTSGGLSRLRQVNADEINWSAQV